MIPRFWILSLAISAALGLAVGPATAQQSGGILKFFHRDRPASMSIHEEALESARMVRRSIEGRYSSAYWTPVDVSGLYWHFVDVIWIFLFPLLYLLGSHVHP